MSVMRDKHGRELFGHKFSCGHTDYLTYVASEHQPCTSCRLADGLDDAKLVSEGWPGLTGGSPSQVEWATKIRADLIRELLLERENASKFEDKNRLVVSAVLDGIELMARQTVNVKWWIDRRDKIKLRIFVSLLDRRVEEAQEPFSEPRPRGKRFWTIGDGDQRFDPLRMAGFFEEQKKRAEQKKRVDDSWWIYA